MVVKYTQSLVAERSKASNPGRTTERGVVLYGNPSSSWYIYIVVVSTLTLLEITFLVVVLVQSAHLDTMHWQKLFSRPYCLRTEML